MSKRLDELSKRTLGSYVRKASVSMARAEGNYARADHSTLDSYNQTAAPHAKIGTNRYRGIVKAVRRLTKEDDTDIPAFLRRDPEKDPAHLRRIEREKRQAQTDKINQEKLGAATAPAGPKKEDKKKKERPVAEAHDPAALRRAASNHGKFADYHRRIATAAERNARPGDKHEAYWNKTADFHNRRADRHMRAFDAAHRDLDRHYGESVDEASKGVFRKAFDSNSHFGVGKHRLTRAEIKRFWSPDRKKDKAEYEAWKKKNPVNIDEGKMKAIDTDRQERERLASQESKKGLQKKGSRWSLDDLKAAGYEMNPDTGHWSRKTEEVNEATYHVVNGAGHVHSEHKDRHSALRTLQRVNPSKKGEHYVGRVAPAGGDRTGMGSGPEFPGYSHVWDRAGKKSTALDESLGPSSSSSAYIHDFVHSKNKMFKGDSTRQRIRRALGAYYKNEEREPLTELSTGTLGRYIKKAALDSAETAVEGDRARRQRKHKIYNKAVDRFYRREKGIARAVKKLAKEGVLEPLAPINTRKGDE